MKTDFKINAVYDLYMKTKCQDVFTQSYNKQSQK